MRYCTAQADGCEAIRVIKVSLTQLTFLVGRGILFSDRRNET